MKVLIKNQQRLIRINQQKLKGDSVKALELLGLQKAELSILLVNDRRMKALNSLYRKKDKTTDVLSFPQNSGQAGKRASKKVTSGLADLRTCELVLGDVVINLQAAKRQAPEHGLLFQEELRWLLVHGILHLAGYDHERNKYSEKKMREKEKELLKYL